MRKYIVEVRGYNVGGEDNFSEIIVLINFFFFKLT